MTKVGEHITLDIIGTSKEYDPSVFEKVIHDIAKASKVTILNMIKHLIISKIYHIHIHGPDDTEIDENIEEKDDTGVYHLD